MSQRSAQCGALCAQAREAREQGNSARANEYINAALRQKPSDLETRRQLAETMWTNGRKSEAIDEFSTLCAQEPRDARLAGRLAVMQWEANQHTAAARTADWVLKLDPQSQSALLIKARTQVTSGRHDEALASYMQLSQVAPDDIVVMIELGDLHLKRGQPDRARPLFRTALQHAQTSSEQRAEIEWLLGVAYCRSDRWLAADPLLENSILQRNSTAEDWCLLGTVRLKRGDSAGARLALERAIERGPESAAIQELTKELDHQPLQTAKGTVTPAGFQELE